MKGARFLGPVLALLVAACGTDDARQSAETTTTVTTSSTTTTTTTTLDVARAVEDELVDLYETRGLEPDAAAKAATDALDNTPDDELSEETVDALKEFVDIFVANRQEIPVYGSYLSEDEAQCIAIEMLVAMGLGGTLDFIGDIWIPMSVEDAHSIVDPVATCTDLVEKVGQQGIANEIPNIDCFTEGLTEADVVRFEILRLTGQREHYFDADIMERCIPGYRT